jgi:hypothetical protein
MPFRWIAKRSGLERELKARLDAFPAQAKAAGLAQREVRTAGIEAVYRDSSTHRSGAPEETDYSAWALLKLPGKECFCVSGGGILLVNRSDGSGRVAHRDDLFYLLLCIDSYAKHTNRTLALDGIIQHALEGSPLYLDPYE